MNRFFIQIVFAVFFIMIFLSIYFAFSDFTESQIKKANQKSLDTTQTDRSSMIQYSDEPMIVKPGYIIASTSAWRKMEGEVIVPSKDTNSISFALGSVDEVWDKVPQGKAKLDDLNLSQEKYDFFYNQTLLPNKVQTADLNGDKKPDDYFLSKIVNCNKCFQYFVDIFLNNTTIYKTTSNDGEVYPLKNSPGFYLSNFFSGNELSTTNPDNVVLSRFEWSNNRFKEVARKTYYLKEEN